MKLKQNSSRKKTTVTLSEELLEDITEMSKEYQSRSQFIEMILQSFVAKRKREKRDARDLAIINQNAERFNRETAEFLAFMGELHEAG